MIVKNDDLYILLCKITFLIESIKFQLILAKISLFYCLKNN